MLYILKYTEKQKEKQQLALLLFFERRMMNPEFEYLYSNHYALIVAYFH